VCFAGLRFGQTSKKLTEAGRPEPIPWRAWMRLAFGKMGIRPADFWAMTFCEWTCAAEGFAEFHGAGEKDLPTPEEIAQAEAEYEAKHGDGRRS